MKTPLCILYLLISLTVSSQNYVTYHTGSETDITTTPQGGSCLMGGATENDQAMIWFLERAQGGDVLVLRASGSNGYNDYFYSELGVDINSVTSIVFEAEDAQNEVYIHEKIENAEAIWFAGGDQWNYVDYWRNSPIDSLINQAIIERNIVIGGTSAGMAILGEFYFSAQHGTVTSPVAMGNPYDIKVAVSNSDFLKIPYLHNIITDTHYNSPDRKGRHFTFIARANEISENKVFGIACNEYTSFCVDENGMGRAFGQYPSSDDAVYLITPNCEVFPNSPEVMTTATPLTWDQNDKALKVCKLYGTDEGINTFDLNDWRTTEGGEWFDWSVEEGDFLELQSTEPFCQPLSISTDLSLEFPLTFYPNPVQKYLYINNPEKRRYLIELIRLDGQVIHSFEGQMVSEKIDVSSLPAGMYLLKLSNYIDYRAYRVMLSVD